MSSLLIFKASGPILFSVSICSSRSESSLSIAFETGAATVSET